MKSLQIKWFFTFVLSLFLYLGQTAQAADTYEACFLKAAKKHGIEVEWLHAISFTESSFDPKSKNRNKDGSRDYGLMQINSLWKEKAKELGYNWETITKNPCENVMFGGHILKENLKRLKSLELAIGAYNAGFADTPKAQKRRKSYYLKVAKNREVAKRYLDRLKKKVALG